MNRDIADRLSEVETDTGLEDLAATMYEPIKRVTPREAARYACGGSARGLRKAAAERAANRAKRRIDPPEPA